MCDILTTHPTLLSAPNVDGALQKSLFKVFSKGMKAAQTPDVQFAATVALCKLMLTATIEDEDLPKQLITCYFEPSTKANAGVRQALSYFIPVYCHSRRENMERMGRIIPGAIHTLLNLGEELDDDEEMVSMSVIANMLIDWTDARKLVVQDSVNVSWDEAGKQEVKAVNGDIHLDLAESLLEKVSSHGCQSKSVYSFLPAITHVFAEEEKKILISMLGKLFITATSSSEKLQSVLEHVTEAIDLKVASDGPSRNALTKLQSNLSKVIGETGVSKKSVAKEEVTMMGNDEGEAAAADEEEGEMLAQGSEEETKMDTVHDEAVAKDSILDELLDDEEEEL